MLASAISWSAHTAAARATSSSSACSLTYLEINGWLITCGGVTVLVDPVLDGNLDFGIPAVYTAAKRVLPAQGLLDTLPALDALLITQGLDDHAHLRTLEKLAKSDPQLPVYAPPSARATLEAVRFEDVTYLASQSRRIELPYLGFDALPSIRLPAASKNLDTALIRPRDAPTASGMGLSVRATSGALVGPPWQQRENGYVLRAGRRADGVSLYIEPHVEFDKDELRDIAPVDAVITPISGQGLPGFELVHGSDASIDLIKRLQARCVLPMRNGAVDASGLSAPLICEIGRSDDRSFERALRTAGSMAEVMNVRPGEPVTVHAV